MCVCRERERERELKRERNKGGEAFGDMSCMKRPIKPNEIIVATNAGVT